MNYRPLSIFLLTATTFLTQGHPPAFEELKAWYTVHATSPSDINQHLPTLLDLAKECRSAMEIGIRSIVSSWAVMFGLAQSKQEERFYIGVDLALPPQERLDTLARLARDCDIHFTFWQANDMDLVIEDVPLIDMLFIDSLHIYPHLTYELNKFSPRVNKYIAMHDTSAPYGEADEPVHPAVYTLYPAYSQKKRGLWPAVEDFLATHPEWKLKKRYFNNHGLTILERVQ